MPDLKKYIVPTIGFAAFVIGGLIAKSKAEDGVDAFRKALASPSED